jgi:hypothetical protein
MCETRLHTHNTDGINAPLIIMFSPTAARHRGWDESKCIFGRVHKQATLDAKKHTEKAADESLTLSTFVC